MSQSNQNPGHSHLTAISLGLIIIAVFALGLTWYTVVNPHLMTQTVTQQQLVTNTLNLYNTQTITSFGTVTSVTTIITTSTGTTTAGFGYGYGYYPNCGYYGCYPSPSYTFNGNYYTTCQSTGSNQMQCSGFEIQNSNGCILLAVPVYNGYTFESQVYQYYTLHNLPSSYPPLGSWVTVTGQLYQGYNAAPNGGSCPGNYINITSISQ
jgi:hypothetical protein